MTALPFFIETKRLWIRPFREEDCASAVTYLNDKAVNEPLVSLPHPYTYAEAMDFLHKMRGTYDAGRPEFFVMADKSTDEMIGAVGVHGEHTLISRPFAGELGYWLGKPFWGQGYMHEAVLAVLSYVFERLDTKIISAVTNTNNLRSQKVLRNAGFTYLGDFLPLQESDRRPTRLVTSWELTRETFIAGQKTQ